MVDNIISSRGYFWWSDYFESDAPIIPTEGTPGYLEIDEDGKITLKLDALIRKDKKENTLASVLMSHSDIRGRVIHGALFQDKKYVVLTELFSMELRVSSDVTKLSEQVIIANRCLISPNRRFSAKDFKKIEISLKGLNEWTGVENIKIEQDERSLRTSYDKPDSKMWHIENDELSIDYTLEYTEYFSQNKIDLEEKCTICYKKNDTFDIEQAISIYAKICDFLLVLSNCDLPIPFPVISENEVSGEVQLVYSRIQKDKRELSWSDFWIRLPLVVDSFGDLYKNWLQQCDILGPGFYLYLATRRNMQLYTEHRYASLIWGLEALHRKEISSTVGSHAEKYLKLNEKVQRITEEVKKDYLKLSEKDKKWLESKLRHANEPSLKDRLEDLFSEIQMIPKDGRIGAFSEKCASVRNDISHFGGFRGRVNYDEFNHRTSEMVTALDVLYHILILTRIGIREEMIKYIFYASPKAHKFRDPLINIKLLDA